MSFMLMVMLTCLSIIGADTEQGHILAPSDDQGWLQLLLQVVQVHEVQQQQEAGQAWRSGETGDWESLFQQDHWQWWVCRLEARWSSRRRWWRTAGSTCAWWTTASVERVLRPSSLSQVWTGLVDMSPSIILPGADEWIFMGSVCWTA